MVSAFAPNYSATSSTAILRGSNQGITTDFSTLTACHAPLHPSALPPECSRIDHRIGDRYGNLGLRTRCFLKPLFIAIFHLPSPTGPLRECGETGWSDMRRFLADLFIVTHKT